MSRCGRWQTTLETCGSDDAGPLRAAVQDRGRRRSTSITWAIAATRDSTPLLVVKPADDRCIRLRCGRPQTSCARQSSDVGSIGLSALRTPRGLVGRTAPAGTAGCQARSRLLRHVPARRLWPRRAAGWPCQSSHRYSAPGSSAEAEPPRRRLVRRLNRPLLLSHHPRWCLAARVALQSHGHHHLTVVFRKRQLHRGCPCPSDGVTRTSLVDAHLLDGERID
jgi:hypothetical protein